VNKNSFQDFLTDEFRIKSIIEITECYAGRTYSSMTTSSFFCLGYTIPGSFKLSDFFLNSCVIPTSFSLIMICKNNKISNIFKSEDN